MITCPELGDWRTIEKSRFVPTPYSLLFAGTSFACSFAAMTITGLSAFQAFVESFNKIYESHADDAANN